MWQAQQAGWPPGPAASVAAAPLSTEEEAQVARGRELRDFISMRRAVLGAGAKVATGRSMQPPARQQGRGRQRAAQTPQQQNQQQPLNWQAIKQQAAQGFEALLRQAGLPVNAGFSRPSSFTAAGLAQRPAAQMGLMPTALGHGTSPAEAAAWAAPGPGPPPWAAVACGWGPQLAQATPPGFAGGWPQQPWQHEAYYGAAPGPLPPPPQQQQWQQEAHCAAPGPQLQQQWQQAAEAYWPPLPAADAGAALVPPGSAGSPRTRLASLPPASSWLGGSLQRSRSSGGLLSLAAAEPQALVLSAAAAATCGDTGLAKQQRSLLKLDSDVCASGSWHTGGLPALGSRSSRPASAAALLSVAGARRSNAGSSSSSSSSGRGSLGSSVLEALVAAAEEGDVPLLDSEAVDTDEAPALVLLPRQPVVAGTGLSASLAQPTAELAAAAVAGQEHQPQEAQPAAVAPAVAPSSTFAAAPEEPDSDPSVMAASALARFEHLQAQLQQLHAGLPPSPAAEGCSATAAVSPMLAAPAARPSPCAAASPVLHVMHQAESFLAQAQALLQRLQVAASPQQAPPQPACLQEPPQGPPAKQEQLPCWPPPQQEVAKPAEPRLEHPDCPEPSWQWQAASWSAAAAQPAAAQLGSATGAYLQWGHPQQQQQQQPAPSVLPLPQPSWQVQCWQGQQQEQEPAPSVLPLPQPSWRTQQQEQEQQLAASVLPLPQPSWQAQQPEVPSWEQETAGEASTAYSAAAPQPFVCGTWTQEAWQQGQQWRQQQPQRSKLGWAPGGYAQRKQAAAAAAPPRPASAHHQPQPQQQQGSYVQVARLAKERAAREAAEREQLRRQNEAARQAARQRALQEQRQHAQQAQEQASSQQLAKRQQLAATSSARGSQYLQRLRVQRVGLPPQKGEVPEWAKAARPLPLLLPPKPAGQQQQQEQQEQQAQAQQRVSSAKPAVSVALAAPEQEQHQHQRDGRRLSEEEQQLQAALAALDARMARKGVAPAQPRRRSSGGGRASLTVGGGPAADLQASLELSSRTNSELQLRLQQSLARLDGELAGLAECPPQLQERGQQQQREWEEQQPALQEQQQGVEQRSLVPSPAEVVVESRGAVAVQRQPPLQEPATASAAEPAKPPPDEGTSEQQPWNRGEEQPDEQQPLQWRSRPHVRSLAAALDAAACGAGTGTGTPTRAVQQAVQPTAKAAGIAADVTCHINVANVGKPCGLPALVASLAPLGSTNRLQAVLPPLRQHIPGRSASSAGPPALHTATRAAARPSRMQPLQQAAEAPGAQWWAAPSALQQQQQQQAGWPAWQQQEQWWQQFPPGWQQYQQPASLHWGCAGGQYDWQQ